MEKEIIDRIKAIRKRLGLLKDSLNYDDKTARVKEIELQQVQDPDFWKVPDKANAIVAELKSIKSVLKPLNDAWGTLEELETMVELADEDPSFAEDLPQMLESLEKELEHLELFTLLSGPNDQCDAILTINARDGGTDANDWADMLLRMYIN